MGREKVRPQNKVRRMKRMLRLHDFEGMEGFIIKDVAHMLRRPYYETLFAIYKLNIRDRFPAHGGEATWIAKKGYSHLAGGI